VKQLITRTISYVLCIALIFNNVSVVSAANQIYNVKQIFIGIINDDVSLLRTAGEIDAGFIPGISQVQSGRDLEIFIQYNCRFFANFMRLL